MTQPMSSPHPSTPNQAQADLLTALVSPSPIYPWAPWEATAEPYFATGTAALDGFDAASDPSLNDSLTEGWQRFSAHLTAQWDNPETSSIDVLVRRLKAQLQTPLPDDLLHKLANTVTTMTTSGQTYVERLVTCAQSVLPNWDAGDLTVLARPLAYSLRDGHSEILDLNLRPTFQTPWASLSEIEQARLSLTLAALALKTMEVSA